MDIGLMAVAFQAAASHDEGLTWREIVAELPHDAASLGVLAFLAFSVALVVWAGRSRSASKKAADEAAGPVTHAAGEGSPHR